MISSPIKINYPKVAILGKPNVGKSTLFNRLLGRRKAITDPTPGVTRDVVEAECNLNGLKILLIDTGGYTLEKQGLNRVIARKSLNAVNNIDLALLLLDAEEISGEDYDFIEALRPFSHKIILVVNKVDNAQREFLVPEKYELGFECVVAISAEHGRNIEILKNHILSLLNVKEQSGIQEKNPEIRLAILGKPNTGKSTLLNSILGEEKSLVAEEPGTTRDVIEGRFFYKEKLFLLLDTAGIRKKKKVKNRIEYYSVNRAIKSIAESDIVILLVDAQEGLTEQDKKIALLVIARSKGLIIALNKWDLLKGVPNQLNALQDRIKFLFPPSETIPILPLCARDGFGLKEILNKVIVIWKQLHRRVDTAQLNKALKSWLAKYNIPVRTKNIKIRYGTQVSSNPLKFVFFINTLKGYPQFYTQYLKNRIRQDLGFNWVPFSVEIRKVNNKLR